MEYRLFQYGTDDSYIRDILEGISHKGYTYELSEEWFHQRYEHNPLGPAILACAFDNTCLTAVLVVERVLFKEASPLDNGACVSCLYVSPDYRGRVVLTDLLMLVEEEARRQGIGILFALNMPVLSLDASRQNWISGTTKIRYRMKPVSVIKSIFKMLDMSKPFVSGLIDKRCLKHLSEDESIAAVDKALLKMNKDYLRWAIATSLQNSCFVIDGKYVEAVVVLGHRGRRLQEAQILNMESKKGDEELCRYQSELVKAIYEKVDVDVISCLDNCHYLTTKGSRGASPVITYCYKILSEDCLLQPEDLAKELVIGSFMMS